ncbi:MAG: S8 family serine peptidase [Caldilinea sp.]
MYSLISRSLSVFSLLAALALLLTPALAASNVPREVLAAQTANEAVAPLTTPGKGIPDRYIVVFKADRVFSAAAVNSKATEAESQFGAQIHYLYDSAVQGYAATLSAQAVEALRKDADVAYIEQDQLFTINDTQTGPPWGLDRIDQRSLPLSNSYTYATDGQGVHAYIIDTGIRSSHTDFSGRIGAGYDAVDGGDPDDCNGHGTHVAGTVGGSTYGVAKRVTLHGVRVLDCNGSGTTSGVVAGINWVTANHTKPAVANMSLGGGASTTLDTALRNSVAAGVVHVVAAGNENTDACNSSPAREPLAITVGATNSSDQRASFSNYGSCLDIFAPGVNILSSWYTGDNATGSLSGTSMASPHVAGVVALHLAGSPSASPADVAASLNNAATTGTVSDPGSGSPNRLLYNLLGPAPTPTPTPTGTPPTATPTLTATPTPIPPPNDDFAQPVGISTLPFNHTMATTLATRAADDPVLCIGFQGGASVWYRLVAPASGQLTLNTFNSNYDTVLAVFTGSRGALTRRACNDDTNNTLQSRVTLPVTAGTIYSIEVAQYSYLNDASTKNISSQNVPVAPWSGGALQINAALTPSQPTPTATPTLLPTATQTPSIPPTATPTPDPGDVLLAVAPAGTAVQLGETFTVTVRVQTTQPVDSAEAHLNFDPAVLQVAAVTAGSTFSTLLQNQFDNTQGTFDFAAGAALGGGAPTSDFVLATILFTATHPSAGTPLTFVSQNPRRSDVYYVGNSVLDRLENGSVRVVERRLVGRAVPPGRPAAPHLRWQIPVTITLQTLLGEPILQQATALDASGYFTLTGLSGPYQIGVRGHNTLRTTLPVTVTEALTAVDFGTLRGGDSNGDNAVSLIDFSILVNTFSRCSTNAGYDPRADFNGDACINLPDFSILRSNFGISGNSQLLPAVHKAEPSLAAPANVRLGIALPAGPLLRGTPFVAQLWLETTPMAVDGVAAYLTFDPAILQVNRIVVSELFSARLEETFDNSQGQIRFAAGSLSTVLNGSIPLATIEFDTVGLGSSTLTFLHSDGAQSEATYDGESILADTADVAIHIVDQLAPPLFLPMISGD